MKERCQLRPDCTWPPHEPDEHPCGRMHIPGARCDYCGKPTPLDGSACPDCWTNVDGLPLADLKAVFASADLSLRDGGVETLNG